MNKLIPMTASRARELLKPLKEKKAKGITAAWRLRLIEALEYVVKHEEGNEETREVN